MLDRCTTGRLRGGIAVLVDGQAAYWVDQAGRVHAANGFAKTWSPQIDYAPAGVDIESVTTAVRWGRDSREQ